MADEQRIESLNVAYARLGPGTIAQILVESCRESGHIFAPEEFWPGSVQYGHLQREMTKDEKDLLTEFQRAQLEFNAQWLNKNMHRMSQDQVVKTLAFHAERDLAGTWPLIQQGIDEQLNN